MALLGSFRMFAQADQSHDKIFDQFLNLSELKTIGEYQYVLGKKLVQNLHNFDGYPIGTAIFQKTIIPGMDSLQMAFSWGKADTIREVKKGIVWIYKTKGTILLDKNKKAHKVYANKSEDD